MKNLAKFRNNILKIVYLNIFIVLAAKVFTSETGFICAFYLLYPDPHFSMQRSPIKRARILI